MTQQPLDYDRPSAPRPPLVWIAVAIVFGLVIVIGAPLMLLRSVHSGAKSTLPVGRDPTITPSAATTPQE